VEAASAPRPRPRRVLVIEDNVDAGESLPDALQMEGHEVAVAYDGPMGLERARESEPEVVICDIGLQGMDGYAVARALRREPALAGAFLIASAATRRRRTSGGPPRPASTRTCPSLRRSNRSARSSGARPRG
jgi:CheY-like chemotaxis protein